jgi:hypothetical protein
MILAASAMIWTGPYAAAVPYSYVAEAREVVSIVIPERHHLVAISGTECTVIVLGGSGAFADRLGE